MAATDPAGLNRRLGRRFGLEIGGACLAISAYLAWRGRYPQMCLVLLIAGMVLTAIAVFSPVALVPIARPWLAAGEVVARIASPVMLAVIYFGLLTPIALLRRTLSRSPFRRERDATTYWIQRVPQTPEQERAAMEHQS